MTNDYTETTNNVHDYDRLYSRVVVDQLGEKVGDVGQVYLDDATGAPSWVTVKTGLFGLKETFVPLSGVDTTSDEIRVPYTKEFIKGAPGVDPDGHIDEAQEAELYAYYGRQGYAQDGTDRVVDRDQVADRDVTTDAAATGAQYASNDADRVRTDVDANADELVAREERLHVGTERVETGRVRLRKHVVTENQTVQVPVTREEVRVERVPLDGTEDVRGGELTEGETEVILHEERPVVTKETVATEKVRLSTDEVTETETVQADLRKERIEVDGDERSLGDKVRDKLDGDDRI